MFGREHEDSSGNHTTGEQGWGGGGRPVEFGNLSQMLPPLSSSLRIIISALLCSLLHCSQ